MWRSRRRTPPFSPRMGKRYACSSFESSTMEMSTREESGSSASTAEPSQAEEENVIKPVNVQAKALQSTWKPPLKTLLLVFFAPIAAMLWHVGNVHPWIGLQLAVCILLSAAGYAVTAYLTPRIAPKLAKKLSGVDIGSRGLGGQNDGQPVPESLGIVSATVFMIILSVLQFCFGSINEQVANFNAALLSVCFATLLGLVDDIIEIKWRHKLLVSILMTTPLLLSYNGSTSIVLPTAFKPYLGSLGLDDHERPVVVRLIELIPTVSVHPSGNLVNLGSVFYAYMAGLVVFSTNAINIYAGINGLEVGQSVVIAGCVSVMNLIEIANRIGNAQDVLAGDARNHLFSLMLMLPFISTSLGLLRFNFYPARVFVGDVYPYYAGMCIAVAAILGHFSKSLLILVLPQLFNFLYSLPQLFGLVPIPRHRLPAVNKKTGFMHASKVAPGDERSNMTLICFALDLFGPMHERTLCLLLLIFQALCGIVGLTLRYAFSGLFFE